MSPRQLSVFLPAWNEAESVGGVIDEICAHLKSMSLDDYEVIVVDDGSTDGTASVVEQRMSGDPHVRLVGHERNRGYGAALRSGFAAARFDHVFFTDGDGQFEIGDLDRLLAESEHADVVVGYRSDRQDPLLRRWSGHLWSAVVGLLFGLRVRDVDCAFKLFRSSDLERIGPLEASGAVLSTELLWKLKRAGCTIHQIPVRHRPRLAGEPSGGSARVIARAFRELLRLRLQGGRTAV